MTVCWRSVKFVRWANSLSRGVLEDEKEETKKCSAKRFSLLNSSLLGELFEKELERCSHTANFMVHSKATCQASSGTASNGGSGNLSILLVWHSGNHTQLLISRKVFSSAKSGRLSGDFFEGRKAHAIRSKVRERFVSSYCYEVHIMNRN